MTCANGVAPVLFPITNVTISSNGYTQTRGIQTGIGTPNQIFALWPATSVNNVIISNSAGCGPSTNYSCYGSYGGSFETSKSGTYDMMTLAQWNGSKSELEEADADLSFIYFQDEIRLSDNSLLPGFPMAMTSPTHRKVTYLEICQNHQLTASQLHKVKYPWRRTRRSCEH
jgi:hypothetical protein